MPRAISGLQPRSADFDSVIFNWISTSRVENIANHVLILLSYFGIDTGIVAAMNGEMSDEKNIENLKRPFELHVFVCTNTRPINPDLAPGERQKASCGPLEAEAVRANLKTWLFEEVQRRSQSSPELKSKFRFRVNGSGCLDFCKKGIAVAIYPQSEFLLFVKNEEASLNSVKKKILEKLDEIEASPL